MQKIIKTLVTGGTGQLGRMLLKRMARNNFQIDALTRSPIIDSTINIRYIQADLTQYETLKAFATDYDVIVHSASNSKDSDAVDVEGTLNLLNVIKGKNVKNFVYISIVGVDKSTYTYYQNKLKAEQLIIGSGIPFTILRVTQFHDFLYSRVLNVGDRETEVVTIPSGLQFQSIDITDVCENILGLIHRGPSNTILHLGGPEVLTMQEIVQAYQDIIKSDKEIKMTSDLNGFQNLFSTGINLSPEHKLGRITWKDYLLNKKREN